MNGIVLIAAALVMAASVAAGSFLASAKSAQAMMAVDSEERRSATLGTFVLISAMIGGLCVLAMFARTTAAVAVEVEEEEEEQRHEKELSSVVVPPIKQESNIVQGIV